MVSSLESMLEAYSEDKRVNGSVLLAWELSYDANRREDRHPRLVGMAVLSTFISTDNYSTDEKSISAGDYRILQPYFDGSWLYIDSLCSTKKGIGTQLVLHAYQLALSQRRTGLIALSYSAKRAIPPESKRIFQALNFEAIIPEASFKVRMFGTWYAKRTTDVDLAGVTQSAFRICTRHGLSAATSDSLMWRCP